MTSPEHEALPPNAREAQQPTRAARRSGRPARPRQWPYALAVVVLVPLCLAFPLYSAVTEDPSNPNPPTREVPAGEAARWQGATWRLEALTRVRSAAPEELPPGTAYVLGVVSVTPSSKKVAKDIATCDFTVRDDRGRRWPTTSLGAIPLPPRVNIPDTCATYGLGPDYLRPGNRQAVAVTFVVPSEVVGRLELEVTVAPPASERRLRFAR